MLIGSLEVAINRDIVVARSVVGCRNERRIVDAFLTDLTLLQKLNFILRCHIHYCVDWEEP